jgi:hypothetical protein
MNQNEPRDEVQRLLERAMKDLPLRRAPATLEARVLGELARRAALPWWRRSFGHWPLPARAIFVVLCAGLIRLAFLEGSVAVAGVHSLHQSGVLPLSWLRDVGVLAATAGNLVALLARTAPPFWVYEGIAVCAVLYAVLFGLGAVVYRTLFLQTHNGR